MILIISLFSLFLLSNLIGESSLELQDSIILNKYYSGNAKGLKNVILFLANSLQGIDYEKNENGIKFLNIPKIRKLKPCSEGHPGQNFPFNPQAVIKDGTTTENQCNCQKVLHSNLMSLMDWARDSAGITTAMVTIRSFSHSQGDLNYYKIDMKSSKPNKGEKSNNDTETPDNKKKEQLFLSNDDLPKLEKVNEAVFTNNHVPIINVYPAERKYKFNDIDKYHRKVHPEDFINVKRVKRKLIVEPENTQVFEIDNHTPSGDNKPNEITDVPQNDKSESTWDIFGIMNAIRKSFFGNFFNPLLDPYQRMLNEEKGLNFDLMGQIRQPTLLQLVKQTFSAMKIQNNTKGAEAKGFLFVVIGGNFSEISNSNSDLIQSVKYMKESNDFLNTLLIVTGNCPEGTENNDVEAGEEYQSEDEYLLPVYARGANYKFLSEAEYLTDISLKIKAAFTGIRSRKLHAKPALNGNNPNSRGSLRLLNMDGDNDNVVKLREEESSWDELNIHKRDAKELSDKYPRNSSKKNVYSFAFLIIAVYIAKLL